MFTTRRNPGAMLARAAWGGATIAVYMEAVYLEGGGAHILLAHNFEEGYGRSPKWMISLTDDGKKISKGDTYSSSPSTHAKSAGAAYQSMRRMVEREFNVGLVHIDQIGGNCPVQAEGTIDGEPFYFRARGQRWTIGIGGDTVMKPDWHYEQPYGEQQFDAGWMSVDEARAFIVGAALAFHQQRTAS